MSAITEPTRGHFIDSTVVQRLLKITDFLVLGMGGLVLATTAAMQPSPEQLAASPFAALVAALLSMLAIRGAGLYEIRALCHGPRNALFSVCWSFLIGAAVFATTGAFIELTSQSWLAGWLALLIVHFGITRNTASMWIRPLAEQGRFRKRIAIVGGGKAAEDAILALQNSRGIDAEIVGIFDDRTDGRSPETLGPHRKVGKIAELAVFARQQRVDMIIVAIPLFAEARLLHILKRLWELPVDIRISGRASALKFSPRAYTQLGNLPLLAVFDRPLNGWQYFLKNAVDRLLAAVAIVLLSPVMIVAALAVKLESDGPVLFRQRRYGFNNELIQIYKFRSMYVDRSDHAASKLVTRDDPRVTKVGRIIRKTSIDELPQLFNVLKGQLSLVGPRPHATGAKAAEALYEQVVDGYFARHKVKPGITGWAQINGWRGETDTKEKLEQRVKHDLEYIDKWSLWFDLYIILKTPFALLRSENAY
jgi:Undecaprenyl-phosphate glucose phosphotransferase